ncbi:MAG: monovalent cation/H+ antiporter subunit D family protein [Deltaproteobacteria bacterium]|nr:monovalent cation/H+ antiporter subunit D family protein [Deltaproteobacteria bacterium]
MIQQFPVLVVVAPLVAAPITLLIRNRRLTHLWAMAVAWFTLFVSANLLHEVLTTGPISYQLGGWAPPWGIEYRVDTVNAFVMVIVAMIASVVIPAMPTRIRLDLAPERMYLFYTATLLFIAGLMGITVTGDAFNVFVFLEITSLASYTLIGLGAGRRAPLAAFSYLVMGTIGGTFVLIGIGLMYQMTGSLNMADLAVLLPGVQHTRTIMVAFAFITTGVSIKLGVFPLHQWLPKAYTYAPDLVSALMSATATKVIFYLLVRMIFTVFGATFVFGVLHLDWLLLPLSLIGMFVASLAAIYQTNIKRLLAYSSIAQIGYMTLGLSMVSVAGLTGSLVHLFNHALMKAGLFMVVASIFYRLATHEIADMRGLGRRMPLTFAAWVVGGLSMIGVPGTVGFISKWYLVLAAIEKGWIGIALLIVLSSLLALVYVWRVIDVAYFQSPPEGQADRIEAPPILLIPTWILVGATVFFGINTTWTVGVAEAAARQLLGVMP